MSHTFETDARCYWMRASLVIAMMIAFGLLPLFVPTVTDPGGFILMINVMAVVSLGFLTYARPRELTLTINETGVEITDRSQRVLVSKRLPEVAEVSLGRWGHVLNFSIGWIVLKEAGRSKPRYFGAISGHRLDDVIISRVRESLENTKKQNKSAQTDRRERLVSSSFS